MEARKSGRRLYVDPERPGKLALDTGFYDRVANERRERTPVLKHVVPPCTGWAWTVHQGQVCRIVAVEGAQVVDFNVWNRHNPRERFWAARSRQIHGAHVSTQDRLWSCLPYLRPMLTFVRDTLPTAATPNGGRCHDLLGSRCDPYLYKLLDGREFDITCHNNLTRAIAPYHLTELDVHDVLNVFQVTGLEPVHEIYFMEPSPARAGDFLEFFAEIDLLCAISVCPSGDLSVWGWGDQGGPDPLETCKPIGIEVESLPAAMLEGWRPPEPVQVRPVGAPPIADLSRVGSSPSGAAGS